MGSEPLDTSTLLEICRRNDAAMVAVFGSMARGEATADSDIDLLVRFSRRKSLLALVRPEREQSFQSTQLVQDGVIRQLQIIGEATKRLSAEWQSG